MTDLRNWLPRGVDAVAQWQQQFGAFEQHPSLQVSEEVLAEAFGRFTARLQDNYPFGHPRYVGQMLKPPHPVATLGYLTAMLINPNNHALDGGPATAAMEKEVVAKLATMFGFADHLGHLFGLVELQVGRNVGQAGEFQVAFGQLLALLALADGDHITGFALVAGDVHDAAVHGHVAMVHQLTGTGNGGAEAEAEANVVETVLEQFQQVNPFSRRLPEALLKKQKHKQGRCPTKPLLNP